MPQRQPSLLHLAAALHCTTILWQQQQQQSCEAGCGLTCPPQSAQNPGQPSCLNRPARVVCRAGWVSEGDGNSTPARQQQLCGCRCDVVVVAAHSAQWQQQQSADLEQVRDELRPLARITFIVFISCRSLGGHGLCAPLQGGGRNTSTHKHMHAHACSAMPCRAVPCHAIPWQCRRCDCRAMMCRAGHSQPVKRASTT